MDSNTPRTTEVLMRGKDEPITSRAFSLADHARALECELNESTERALCLRTGLKAAIDYIAKVHDNGWLSGGEGFLESLRHIHSPNAEHEPRRGTSRSAPCSCSAPVEYDYCPECLGRFSFNKPTEGKCPWCGYVLPNGKDERSDED